MTMQQPINIMYETNTELLETKTKLEIKKLQQQQLVEPEQQQKKQLTFDEICPQWSHYFDLIWKGKYDKADEYENEMDLDIADPNRCVLGEAWNFDNNYSREVNYCNECDRFSFDTMVDFYSLMTYRIGVSKLAKSTLNTLEKHVDLFTNKNNWREHEYVRHFVSHFNNNHVSFNGKKIV